MKFYNVSHLEMALQRWEEFNLLVELINDFGGKDVEPKDYFKSTSCWREFRSFLLSGKNISCESFKEKFILSEKFFYGKRFWIDLPCVIKKWTEESRSVFFLEEDLQVSLMETSLENINWTDLRLPFNSFIVNLKVPMVVYKNRKSSSMMITLYQAVLDKNDVIEVMFFDDEQKLDFTPYEREIIEEYLKNKNTSKLSLVVDKIKKALSSSLETYESASIAALAVIPKTKETKISTSLVDLFRIVNIDEANRVEHKAECTEDKEKDKEKFISFFSNGLQIALGLCLYLQTIPSSSKKHGNVVGDSLEWIDLPKKSKLGRNAITDISKVCSVGNAHLVLAEERAVLEIKKSHVNSSEKSPHFRRGTWCRKSGAGNDPNAPRIIWRRPTMVRSDKLQKNSLPIGQKVIVG